MLQQTRVAVVVERYEPFLRRFPSVQALAAARESSVLAEWSGLGYYRRARNLHACAKVVARERAGDFPNTADGLQALPGIGKYTAAAIASIAFGEPVAVVDGNVERVLARLVGSATANGHSWKLAQEILDTSHPGDFNQAMMELGATVCLPQQPQCATCPLRRFCRTRGPGENSARKSRQFKRELTYGLGRRNDSVLLVQRPEDRSLMPGMWELPEIARPHVPGEPLFSLRHSITVSNFTVRVMALAPPTPRGTWVRHSRLSTIPLTGLAKKILRRAEIIK
jgi:A/G-specific adenine glycosylase